MTPPVALNVVFAADRFAPPMESPLPLRATPPAAPARAAAGGEEAAVSSSSSSPDEEDARDVALMRRVGAGNREAFTTLVEAHSARVVGTVARMLGPEGAADAEDVAQQVFLRVWKSAARYQPTAKFTTWLFTIARNLVFNELRRRKNRPTASLDAPAFDHAGEEGSGGPGRQLEDREEHGPDAALLESELQDAIEAAIGALPETQRMALILRRYEELSYEGIAQTLDLTVPSVKSLLFRARGELRVRLARYLEG